MSTLRTLPEALADAARAEAGYVFVSETDDARSYADVRAASLSVARALGDAGIRRGDLVALILADAEHFLTALFGTSLAGAIPASVYPPATSPDLSRYMQLTTTILRTSGARAIITSRELAPAFDAVRVRCPLLDMVLCREDLNAPPREPGALPSLDDIAFVQFTSGSTSSPKGVALTHANVCANVSAFAGPAGVSAGPGDVAVTWLPLNHDMGLVGMVLGALYTGCPCVVMPPQIFVRRPAEWLRAMTRHRGTISFAPNFAYDLCVRRVKDSSGIDLSGWRVAGCGAEPIHPPTLAAFAEKFAPAGFRDSSFLACYGLAEHVLAATLPPRGRAPRTDTVVAEDLTERRIAIDRKSVV